MGGLPVNSTASAGRDGEERAPSTVGAKIRAHVPLMVVLAAYAGAACMLPTLADVPINDDWFYARSVERLLHQHVLTSGPVTTTLVFQVAWGALFAAVFGFSHGVLRLSTVAMVFLSGWALYGLCRELAIDRTRSALAVALYLFNPLGFVLSFTFMSDPHFTALLVLAALCYVRGLRPGGAPQRLLGSAFSALAFLVRHHGLLIPLAVVAGLAAARRLKLDRGGFLVLLQVAGVPAATSCLYYLWLRWAHGIPPGQSSFLEQVIGAGFGNTLLLVWLLVFFEAMYVGLFFLPAALATLPVLPGLIRSSSPAGRHLFGTVMVLLLVPAVLATGLGLLMPYIPSFLNRGGLGPNDLVIARPALVARHHLIWVTAACALSALVFFFVSCRKFALRPSPEFPGAMLILSLALWQAAGVVLPSFARLGWHADGVLSPSLDRYLLPLLPLVICIGLWALSEVRLRPGVAWTSTAAFALCAVAGTHDSLALHDATWQLARRANAAGIPDTKLDAGATWDGSHLLDDSLAHNIPVQTPDYAYTTGNPDSLLTEVPPWWIWAWAPATDSTYIIVGEPVVGFAIVDRIRYPTWAHRQPTYLYLVKRPSADGG